MAGSRSNCASWPARAVGSSSQYDRLTPRGHSRGGNQPCSSCNSSLKRRSARLELIAVVRRLEPDTPVVAVADVKLPDAERAAWAAALFDLGARFVLFPPLTKPVLEDVASGLMAAAIRRVVGEAPSTPVMPALSEESVLDLADEEADA